VLPDLASAANRNHIMKTNHMPQNTYRVTGLAVLLALTAFVSGCTTCNYNPALHAQLGKTKTDVAKAFGSAAIDDVQTARNDMTALVTLAEKDAQTKCPEPLKQVQDIKAIFDGTNFARKGSKIYQHKEENVAEAIEIAIKTQDNLKK
jgi:hypothetical protein